MLPIRLAALLSLALVTPTAAFSQELIPTRKGLWVTANGSSEEAACKKAERKLPENATATKKESGVNDHVGTLSMKPPAGFEFHCDIKFTLP